MTETSEPLVANVQHAIGESAVGASASLFIAEADLDLAYLDAGSKDAEVVLLLHGWPDDASTWAAVALALNKVGFRTITPSVRGFGASRFRSAPGERTGDTGILCLDAMALMDHLGIARFHVAGHDWGSNMAEALAVGWPDRVISIAMLSSPPRLGGMPTPPFEQTQRQWYHWFQATKRGAQAVRADPKGFAHIMWRNWAPPGWFEEATFERVAASFENPDWVAVTLHSYRARWGEAEPDPRGAWLEEKVKATQSLSLPCLYFQGECDGVNPPSTTELIDQKFTGPFERLIMPGIGHFPTRETPDLVASRLIAHFRDPASTCADLQAPK